LWHEVKERGSCNFTPIIREVCKVRIAIVNQDRELAGKKRVHKIFSKKIKIKSCGEEIQKTNEENHAILPKEFETITSSHFPEGTQ